MLEERESYYEENSYDELLGKYEDMLKNDKLIYFDVEEFESIIDYYLDNLDYNKAFTAAEIAFLQHPNSAAILLKKSQVFLEKGHPAETLKILEELENYEVFNFEIPLIKGNAYCLLGNHVKAEEEFNRSLELSVENKLETLFNISSILTENNNYKLAIEYLVQAFSIEQNNLDIIYELAYCHMMEGDYEKSIFFYNKYLDIDPFADNIWFALGEIYDKLDDYNKAIEAYDFALALNNKHLPAYFNKANNLLNQGDAINAIKILNEVLKSDAKNLQALCCIGEAYEKINNYSSASLYYNQVIEIDPFYPDGWYGLGIVEMYRDNYNLSSEYIKKAIDFDNDNGDYWYAYGKVLVRMKAFNKAKAAFKKAIEIDIYDFESWLLYADIFWVQGIYNEAINILLNGYEYNSGIAEYTYKIAAYFICLNNKEQAVKYLMKALSINNTQIQFIYNYIPEDKIPKYITSIINKYKV